MAIPGKIRTKNSRNNTYARELGYELTPEQIREKVFSADRSFRSDWKKRGILLEKVDVHPLTFFSYFFLYADRVNSNYLVVNRALSKKGKQTKIIAQESFSSLAEAKSEFNQIKENVSKRWLTVDHHLKNAAKFKVLYKENSNRSFGRYPLNQLSFLLAVNEVDTDGYNFDWNGDSYKKPGADKNNKSKQEENQKKRRYITNLLGNPEVPNFENISEWEDFLEDSFEAFANDVNQEGTTSTITYNRKCDCIISTLESLKAHDVVFENIYKICDRAKKIAKDVESRNTYNKKEGVGSIVGKDHFDPIMLDKLEVLFEKVWDGGKGKEEFKVVILALSTMLRPTELEELIDNPSLYITERDYLDYRNGKLITKTLRTADMEDLTDPLIQVVARVILFHQGCELNKNYFRKNNKNSYRSIEDLEDCFFRRFRTTGATMLSYCRKAKEKEGRTTSQDVQVRLGHTTTAMAETVYAKKVPSSKNPRNYFGFTGDVSIENEKGTKELISQNSSMWDSWLLGKYIQKQKEFLKDDQKALNEFLKICLEEGRKFNKAKNGDDEDVEGFSF